MTDINSWWWILWLSCLIILLPQEVEGQTFCLHQHRFKSFSLAFGLHAFADKVDILWIRLIYFLLEKIRYGKFLKKFVISLMSSFPLLYLHIIQLIEVFCLYTQAMTKLSLMMQYSYKWSLTLFNATVPV